MKRKLRVWRAQKCNPLVGAETALTCAESQTNPFHGGDYRPENGNMRNFRPTNRHGTMFAPKQWLHQKEATGFESSKMYCTSGCRNPTSLCGVANYPVPWGGVYGREWKYAKFRAYQQPWYRLCTKAMVTSKGSYGYGELKNIVL